MKAKEFSEEQMVGILREAEKGEESIGQVCRRYGISDVTFFRWRRKFGGVEVPEMRRLRELEKENARLKRILAERDLELDVVRELLSKNS